MGWKAALSLIAVLILSLSITQVSVARRASLSMEVGPWDTDDSLWYDEGFISLATTGPIVSNLNFKLGIGRTEISPKLTALFGFEKIVLTPVLLSIQYQETISKYFTPYIEVGIGYYWMQLISDDADAPIWYEKTEAIENNFGYHAGIGIEYEMSRYLALVGGINYIIFKPFYRYSEYWDFGVTGRDFRLNQELNLNPLWFFLGIKLTLPE